MNLIGHLLPPFSKPLITTPSYHLRNPIQSSQNNHHNHNPNPKPNLFSNLLLSIALTVSLNSPQPSLAIPFLSSQSPTPPPSTTPFAQSRFLKIGLENGKIIPCPSTNPSCVSTNPKSSNFAFPWTIPENSTEDAIKKLQEAILETQKNANIRVVEDTPNGQYLQAVVDGGFGKDIVEFLVKGDVVSYRCMAAKVTYLYPFTTALGDSKGQEERMKMIVNQLGWYAPSFDSMD